MKTLLTICCVLGISLGLPAQPADAAETVSRLSKSAEAELAKSITELNALREQIANEKVPLATELGELEQRVSGLRKEHDQLTRTADSGNLETAAIKAEIKAREDELGYVGNLLDEFARTFETKVNISELASIGPGIIKAKEAAADTNMTQDQKFATQLALADVSLQRLDAALGGMRFAGVAVDMQGTVVEGQYALIGPVALFRAADGAAGVVVAQAGSDKPLMRPLEGEAQAGLSAMIHNGEGDLPLDPSLGGALQALVQKTNLIHIFVKGGPIMWPLLIASMLALATVLERVLFLGMERKRRDVKAREVIFTDLERGDVLGAIRNGSGSKDCVVRMVGYALTRKDQSLANALQYAQAQELKRYQRGIPVLDTVITLAPLLGLLGTVTGMMGSFSLIGGDLGAPGAITGGIAEALIATAFGLGIAILCVLPFNFLNARIDEVRHEVESAAKQVELLVHKDGTGQQAAALHAVA